MKLLILTSILISGSALANEFPTTLCQHGEQQRKIEVVYTQGAQLPCEVHYTKSSGTQVLWKAQGEAGYCEAKATALIEKQKGWGWQCDVEAMETPEPTVEPQLEQPKEPQAQAKTETVSEGQE